MCNLHNALLLHASEILPDTVFHSFSIYAHDFVSAAAAGIVLSTSLQLAGGYSIHSRPITLKHSNVTNCYSYQSELNLTVVHPIYI